MIASASPRFGRVPANDREATSYTVSQQHLTTQIDPRSNHTRSMRFESVSASATRTSGRTGRPYRNNWNRHPVDESKQVAFDAPLRKDPIVAIVGGGLAGLCCAQELANKGIRSVVFDTGEHSAGGRLATRTTRDRSIRAAWLRQQQPEQQQQQLGSANLTFDHAAQYFTVSDPRFQSLVDGWQAAGVVRPWTGPVGTLRRGGAFEPLPSSSPTRYVAVHGMRSLAKHMESQLVQQHAQLVEVRRPLWVGKMEVPPGGQGWKLMGVGKSQGIFDCVVIAHNGKCANRLVGPTGAPLVAKQLMGLRLSAVWALMVAFDRPLDLPFEGAFVENSEVLSWAANNTAKLQLQHQPPGINCWTLISTNAFGQKNKVPQEAVPEEVQAKVAGEMLRAFAEAVGMPFDQLPEPVFTRAQLWGAALPTNTPRQEFILDALSRVGVAGDWCSGSSMQAAAISGIGLARALGDLRGVGPGPQLEALKVGLTAPFVSLVGGGAGKQQQGATGAGAVETREIGQFPSSGGAVAVQPSLTNVMQALVEV